MEEKGGKDKIWTSQGDVEHSLKKLVKSLFANTIGVF